MVNEGYAVLNPELTKELNKADTLKFTLPPSNVNYNDVSTMTPLITAFKDDERIFRGRCINDESDFHNQKPLHCEGELAFLNDSIVRPYTFSGTVKNYFVFLIENHNSHVEAEKRFEVGEVTVIGDMVVSPSTDAAQLKKGSSGQAVKTLQTQLSQLGYDIIIDGVFGSQTDGVVRQFQRDNDLIVDGVVGKQTRTALSQLLFGGATGTIDVVERTGNNYSTTFNEIQEQLLNKLGGYIMPRHVKNADGSYTEYLDYLAESGGDNSQTIEFGLNLIDLKTQFNVNDVFTVLIPLGAQTGTGDDATRLTIESVNNGKDFLVNESALAYFGRIEKIVTFDDVTSATELYRRAAELVLTGASVAATISASAIDLNNVNVNVEKLVLGQYNRVYSPPHSIDANFQHSRSTINFGDPTKSKYTFGVVLPRLTDRKGK